MCRGNDIPSRICRGSGTGERISVAATSADRLASLADFANTPRAASSAFSPASISESIEANAGFAAPARSAAACRSNTLVSFACTMPTRSAPFLR
jgi:hypothetical protein